VVLAGLALGFGSGAADLRAQCGAAKPTGATLVQQGSGIFLAPGAGKQNFSQYPLNLANYSSGGLLTIQIALGNGASAASFDLFAGNAVISAGSTTAQPLASQTNVAPGACTTLTYKFPQAGSYILGVTGAPNSPANSLNTFQYTAYVQPTLTRLRRRIVPRPRHQLSRRRRSRHNLRNQAHSRWQRRPRRRRNLRRHQLPLEVPRAGSPHSRARRNRHSRRPRRVASPLRRNRLNPQRRKLHRRRRQFLRRARRIRRCLRLRGHF